MRVFKNRLWINKGAISQRYFDRVGEIGNVMNKWERKDIEIGVVL